MGGPRRRPAAFRNPARGRAGRAALALLLMAGTVGWIGEGDSVAAAPALLISVDPKSGGPLSSDDYSPSVSGDGNIVVFNSSSFNSTLIESVYVRNLVTGTTTPVPFPAQVNNTTGGVLSRDGCHVAFLGQHVPGFVPARWDVYAWNRCLPNNVPTLIAAPGLTELFPVIELAISADGRYVAYYDTPTSSAATHRPNRHQHGDRGRAQPRPTAVVHQRLLDRHRRQRQLHRHRGAAPRRQAGQQRGARVDAGVLRHDLHHRGDLGRQHRSDAVGLQ